MRKAGAIALTLVVSAGAVVGSVSPADAVVAKWRNCTVVHQRLPHGVGRANAHDHTSGTPVTNFRHDTATYRTAMRANGNLDRDRDGIACEKA